MIVTRRYILLLLIVLASFKSAFAATLLSDSESVGLAPQLEFGFTEHSLEYVSSLKSGWTRLNADRVNLGFTERTAWFRADIENVSSNLEWYLTLSNTRLDYVEFYLVTDQGIQTGIAGDKVSKTDMQTALPTFRFALDKGARGTLYFKVRSDTKIAFYPTVRGSYKYGEYQAYRKHLHYFYIALLAFFTLSQISLNRAPIGALNFFYAAGLLFAFLHIFLYYGEGNAVLWPQNVYLKNRIHFVSASMSFMCFTLFLQCYLRTWVATPNFHKVFQAFSAACGMLAFVMLLPVSNVFMVLTILVESAVISVLAIVGTVRCIQVGNRWAYGLGIPLVFSVVALIIYALTFLGLLPFTRITSNLILWSLPLDIIMVSGSFVYRHVELQKENRKLLESLSKNELQTTKNHKQSPSRLSNIDEDKTLRDLVDYLDTQKAYLESGLTLDHVATAISVRPDQLSAVINSRLNTSFSNLLNLKRLNAAAKLLIDEKNVSILDVSMQCGFGSKSSFNRLFKEQFDTTPSQYRKLIRYNRDIEQ